MKKILLSGLALLLPLALTFLIVLFILNFLTNPFVHSFEDWATKFSPHFFGQISPKALHYIFQVIILITLFFVTVITGALGRLFVISYFLKLGDKIINRLPIVNKIYKTTKDIIRSLFSPDAGSFQQVVLVPFPSKSEYCLGLLSEAPPKACQELEEDELATVLLPTAPHPISGYLLIFKKKDVIEIDMSIEDAIKFTVSCGIVHPENFQKKN
ncbi:MAG: hypothetical protein S4CHLAM7_14670 [Chlamydiae bacterium]|nr:hypothetical protein [Chlamydiota bacterium]